MCAYSNNNIINSCSKHILQQCIDSNNAGENYSVVFGNFCDGAESRRR